jgi:ABC-type nickel/cobalt efflux system permease component RcnA
MIVTLLVAVLLGLRHATDPDHLTAVSTLVMSDRRDGARRARSLGAAWGLGHATTLVALGLPVVLFRASLPGWAEHLAEGAIGLVIAALALRLLVRWRRGYFHAHPHAHGEESHAHPHVHEHAPHPHEHDHPHPEALGRSARAAFGIGLLHGAGGSAAVGILLVASIPGRGAAAAGLVLFAAATALSMAALSAALGSALARAPIAGRLASLAPAMGTAGLVFGACYAALAFSAL